MIVADGVEQTCKGRLPLPACGTPGLVCDGALASIGESGCALASAAHSFSNVHFRSGPSQVKIRVEHDGAVVADEVLSPTYRTTQPNGPNCEPTCRQASATLKLEEP